MLAWVVLLAISSLSGLYLGFAIDVLFSTNGQFHFLPASDSVLSFFHSAVVGLNILFKPSAVNKESFWLGPTGSDVQNGGNDIDVTFSISDQISQ